MNLAVDFFILLLPILVCGLFVFKLKPGKKWLTLLLAFSGAYLLSITVLHLIPHIYLKQFPYTGFFILLGFFIQLIIEFFSEGIEHGHIHEHPDGNRAFPVTMMFALSIHSFLEGVPLAEGNPDLSSFIRNPLLIGIILHNIPISISLVSMFLVAGIAKRTILFWLFIFACMTPAGMVAGELLGDRAGENYDLFINYILGIVVGIFLHISTTILFESGEEHRFNLVKLAVILLGVGASLVTLWL